MQVFLCTFLIKLQYVKKIREASQKRLPPTTFEAVLRGAKNHIIATGSSRPTLMNDTAWFNERFQIKCDLLFNPQSKAYNQSPLTLDIKCSNRLSTTSHVKQFSLPELASKKLVSEKEYYLSGGLIASLEFSCTEIQSKGVKQLRRTANKPEESKDKINVPQSFLLLKEVSFSAIPGGEGEKESHKGTPEFPQREEKEVEKELQSQPLDLEDPSPLIQQLKQQFNREQQEHRQTKIKLKSVKELLEQQYNISREQTHAIQTLNKQIQSQKQRNLSLENHLSQTQNLCTALSATLSHKETEIIESEASIDDLKQKINGLLKKIQLIEPLQRSKAQWEWENGVLKKQNETLKLQLNKLYLSENEERNQIQRLKSQILKIKKSREKIEEELFQKTTKEKSNSTLISKLTDEIDSIKAQTAKWRSQFAVQSQRKDEEINHLQQHYSQIFHRYTQMQKNQQLAVKMVKRETYENMRKEYEKKLEQNEEKESKLRQQLQIIEQQIVNLQQLLQEKEENEETLLDHIKKLQKDVDNYAIDDNWWSSILDKQLSSENLQNGNEEISKLMNKNNQLIQVLHRNSYIILEGQKFKLELAALKKDHEQLLQKTDLYRQQEKQLKQKIANLYKENKKLQEKNFIINREKQSLNKKNLWLEEEITQSKILEKEARQDYQIVSFQLFKIHTNTDRQKGKASNFLTVINENSEDMLPSSRKLLRQSSIKESVKVENEGHLELTIFQQLSKALEQRSNFSTKIHEKLQQVLNQEEKANKQDLQKHLKKLSLSTPKIKSALLKSGNREYIKQWESIVTSLLNQMQQIIINN